MQIVRLFVITILIGLVGNANAALLNYSITGSGSGSLGGADFIDADFSIDMVGDTALYDGLDINPLESASITIEGFGTANFLIGTRLGFNSDFNAVFFSRSTGSDLFDFLLDAPIDLTSPFSAVEGTDVYALNQFANISTSLGLLTFRQSSDVMFSAVGEVSKVPAPAAAFLFAPALLGFMSLRRKAKQA